jgi:hypothetical protein
MWVTKGGTSPLPSEEENCELVEVTDEEVQQVIQSIPKLDTLILVKTMLKKHSFQVGIMHDLPTLILKSGYVAPSTLSFIKHQYMLPLPSNDK